MTISGLSPAQRKPSLEISAKGVFCQLRFEPTSSASSKASCNFLISRHSTASLKGCEVSVLYWKGSFKQCRTKDLLVISYLLTYGWLYSTSLSPTRTAPVSTLHELVAKAPSAWLPQLPVRLTNVGRWSFNNFELIQKTGPSGQASSSARSSGCSRPNCSASLITTLRPRAW